MRSRYRYVAIFFRPGAREPLAQAPLDVDWLPAGECIRLAALRRGMEAEPKRLNEAVVEPNWDRHAGQPYVAGVRAEMKVSDRRIIEQLGTDYFISAAIESAAGLVRLGVLQDREECRFTVCAFPCNAHVVSHELSLTSDEAAQTIHATDFETLLSSSSGMGPLHPEDIPVFVSVQVLSELADRARQLSPARTGGILIGRLHRDPLDAQTMFVTVTAQVPARECVAGVHAFAPPPETWTAATAAIRLRGRDEIYVGWWHSLPAYAFCEECEPDCREDCPIRDPRGLFSQADRAVHRTSFPRAFSVSLVATHTESGVWLACFGWRKGRIVQRGLRVMGAEDAYGVGRAPYTSALGDLWHGSPCT